MPRPLLRRPLHVREHEPELGSAERGSPPDRLDSAAKGHKLHASLRGILNETYLDDLREKTHRGLEGQARKGNSTGGRVYGYRAVPIEDASGRKDEYGRPWTR